MSARWFNWARSQPVPRSAAKFVLVMLGDMADDETGYAYAHVETLCANTALNSKTVSSSVAYLVEQGWLEDTKKRMGRTRRLVLYRLKVPNTPEIGRVSESSDSSTPDSEAASGSQGGAEASNIEYTQKRNDSENGCIPTDPETGALAGGNTTENGTVAAANTTDSSSKYTQKRVSNEEQTKDQKQNPAAASVGAHERTSAREGELIEEAGAEQPEPSAFDRFWAIYPKQSARLDCVRRWRVMDLDPLAEQIVADVERRKLHDDQWLRGFAPDPKNYLGGRRWEDVLPAVDAIERAANAPRRNVLRQPISDLDAGLALAKDMLDAEVYTPADYDAEVARLRARFPAESEAPA